MKTTQRFALLAVLATALVLPLLTGCGKSQPYLRAENPAQRDVREIVRQDVTYPIDVYDPIEGWNRGVYRFNYYFDKYLFLPVTGTYSFLMPDPLEKGVHNAFRNIGEVNNFINCVLQLKLDGALVTLWRFVLNTTFGLGGLFDFATPAGLPRQSEDFGQTLGRYGLGHGPYLVLPVFGPSNLRDGVGLAGDFVINSYTDPVNLLTDDEYSTPYAILEAIDTRAATAFRYDGSGSPFEYELVRMLYTQMRELEIEK
jgi:phospholipid-binding lipoprotein MlaA